MTNYWAPHVNGLDMSLAQKQGSGLTNIELTGGEVTTDVLPSTPHVK